MSVEFEGEPQRIMVMSTPWGKPQRRSPRVSHRFGVIAAVALFSSYIETLKTSCPARDHQGQRVVHRSAHRDQRCRPEGVHRAADRRSIAFLFSSFAIRAVSRTVCGCACKKSGGSSPTADHERRERPDYAPVIDICTAASLRSSHPGLLAVLSPVIIGFGINYFALGAFLAAVILTASSWRTSCRLRWCVGHAKKFIEDGNYGGKGSDATRRVIVTRSANPFKDTAGPGTQPADQGHQPRVVADPAAVISMRHKRHALRDRGWRV